VCILISRKQIKYLYGQYLELVRLEVQEFGVKPTEVRHLIGRLAEFHCAIETGGTLAHTANQHGFDVTTPDGKRISVKGTGQITAFVSFKISTFDKFDEAMVVQYLDGEIRTIYRGPASEVKANSRLNARDKTYEFRLNTAHRLNKVGKFLYQTPAIPATGLGLGKF